MTQDSDRIVKTSDGSDTLYSEKYKAHYHSIHGAIEESIHVFLSAGLEYGLTHFQIPITILEIGFGTGLNAILSMIKAHEGRFKIHYTGIEKHPISENEFNQLNYLTSLQREEFTDAFLKMHQLPWNQNSKLSEFVEFKKLRMDFEEIDFEAKYDVIYFDAFAPASQPQLWETPFLKKIHHALKPGGILVTYCAKGSFKRALKELGFSLQALNGPTGKREMTRAIRRGY